MRYLIFVLFAISACAHTAAPPREEPARIVGEDDTPKFTGPIKESPAEDL
jgi:hypothetical protein